jgi:hypothetical protein
MNPTRRNKRDLRLREVLCEGRERGHAPLHSAANRAGERSTRKRAALRRKT